MTPSVVGEAAGALNLVGELADHAALGADNLAEDGGAGWGGQAEVLGHNLLKYRRGEPDGGSG